MTSLIVALWGTIDKIKSYSSNQKLVERERKKRLKSWIKELCSFPKNDATNYIFIELCVVFRTQK